MTDPGEPGVGEADETDVLEQHRSTGDEPEPDAVIRDDVDVADAWDQLRDAEPDEHER